MTIFEQYAISATHLYGLVPIQQVLDLYNRHHGTSLNRFEAVDSEVLLEAFVYEENGWFIHEAIYVTELFNTYFHNSEGKPYYLPSQAELLCYLDNEYIEKPASYNELESFIKTRTKKEPEEIALELRDMLFQCISMDRIIDRAKRLGLHLQSQSDMSRFLLLLKTLNNDLRLWENKAHTSLELNRIYGDKPIKSANDMVLDELTMFLTNHGQFRFKVPPKNRPYLSLLKRQKVVPFDSATMRSVDALGEKLAGVEMFTQTNIYNLLCICPFAYITLSVWMTNIENEQDYEDLLRCIVNAFETANPTELKAPSQDFYELRDNLYYILALDNLGYLLKMSGRFKEALGVYKKALKLDLSDRKRIREQILICYFGVDKFDEFDEAISQLPEDSLYRIYLRLFHFIMMKEPFDKQYYQALQRSPLVMDALGSDDEISDEASEEEKMFVIDFYQVARNTPDLWAVFHKNGMHQFIH